MGRYFSPLLISFLALSVLLPSSLSAPIKNVQPQNVRKLSRDVKNVVRHTFTIQEWVVDYMRPTVDLGGAAARQTPFNVPDSQRKDSYLVNGQYPGPEIVVYEGDTIEVVVQNQLLSESVSIHWHGIHMTNNPFMDGARGVTQSPILPGDNFTYSFNAYPAGTHYWHAHMDAVQSARGIKGPLIVQKRDDPFEGLYKEEIIVSISDEWQDPSVCLKLEGAMPGNDVCADIQIAGFNGQYGNGSETYPFPLITVTQGTCYRLRFIMMGSNAENFVTSIAGHTMTLLSVDGTDVHPINVSSVNVHLGERYDILLCANQEVGNYLVNMTYDYACALTPGNFIPPGFSAVPACSFFGFLSYEGSGVPTTLNGTGGGVNPKVNADPVFDLTDYPSYWLTSPLEPIPQPAEPDVRFVVNMGLKGPTYSGPESPPLSQGRWYMDVSPQTRTFYMPTSPLYVTKGQCGVADIPIFEIPENSTVVELVINNLSPTAHIIHLHGVPFTVINYASFPWCDINHPTCFTLTYHANPCPRKDVQVGDPEYPNLVKGMYWGCAYDPNTDPVTQNLTAPLIKDTMQVWQRSWAVIRFRADNPGYWMFHCHMEQHIPLGMTMVFNVLPSKQPPPPADLPGYQESCIIDSEKEESLIELEKEVKDLEKEKSLLEEKLMRMERKEHFH